MKNMKMFRHGLMAGTLFAVTAIASGAGASSVLVGSVTDQYLYPTSADVYASSTLTVGTPTVCPGADPICAPFARPATLWASGLTISVSEDGGSSYSPASFNGMRFSNLTFSDGSFLTGFTLDTDLAGLTAANISFAGNWIDFNAQGLDFGSAPYHINLNLITSGGVPEPASWAMMLGGFGGIGGAMRARRKATISFA